MVDALESSMALKPPRMLYVSRMAKPATQPPPPPKLKVFEVTFASGERLPILANIVTERDGWVMFRVKNVNVGRFPAATTRFREVKPGQEPSTGSE